MKSERRHELKANELSEWIENLPEWLQANKFAVIIGAIVVLLVLASVYLKWVRPKNQITQEQVQFTQMAESVETGKLQIVASRQQDKTATVRPDMLRQTADQLDSISRELPQNTNEAFALIKRGEALRAAVHYAPGDVTKEQRNFQIDKAVNAYQEAINKAGDDSQILAQAKFGLGLAQEELGKFDDAKKLYNELATDAKYAGTVIHVQASHRLAAMSDYQGTFEFISVPLTAPDANKPAMQAKPVQPTKPAEAAPAPAKPADANKPAAPTAPEANTPPAK